MDVSLKDQFAGSFDLNNIDFISVMDRLDEGVIIADNQGIIRYYNETQCQIDELDFDNVVGKKVTDIYELCGNTSMIMLCLKLVRPIRNKTFFYKTKLGKVANTICSTFPIIQDSQLCGAICFVKDYKILRNTTPVISIPEIKPIKENGTRYTFADIIGRNNELIRSVNTSRTAADSSSPVMLIGETGTGKELFAQSIHNYSARSHKPFFAVNCAAIPDTLLEGFLFGTTKGAFTGAINKPGLLEQANGSTLFLDELLAMPVSLQAKLLRVLQEKKVCRLGSTNEINLTINSIGQYLLYFLPMSLYTGPGIEGNWIGSWTVFYWAWWMSWAPFVAVFIARISKGRSIRAVVAATLLLPTLGNFLWYGVVGGAGISFDVTATLKEHGVESAIFAIAQHLPLTGILSVFLIFLIATFFLTSANSAAIALAMFVSGQENPNKNLRAFWGIALGVVAAVLAGTGQLKAIQTASIATAFPLMFLLLFVLYGVFRGLNNSLKEADNQ